MCDKCLSARRVPHFHCVVAWIAKLLVIPKRSMLPQNLSSVPVSASGLRENSSAFPVWLLCADTKHKNTVACFHSPIHEEHNWC